VAAVSDPSGPDLRPRRPGIVTFTLIMAWLAMAAFGYALARYTWFFIAYWSHSSGQGSDYLQLALRATLTALPLSTLILSSRYPRYVRWSGALMIASYLALPIHMLSTQPFAPEILLGALMIASPISLWLGAFVFSKKSRAWFNWLPEAEAR
jgi:hypothetical protein